MYNFWVSSCGRVELNISRDQAARGYHSGDCAADIAALMQESEISGQLLALDPPLVAGILQEYGGWTPAELSNDADNLERLLWIACGDLIDNQFLNESEKMKTLSEAIAGRGLVESKEIKKLMSAYTRRWNNTSGRGFPSYTGQSTAEYISQFVTQNHLIA